MANVDSGCRELARNCVIRPPERVVRGISQGGAGDGIGMSLVAFLSNIYRSYINQNLGIKKATD